MVYVCGKGTKIAETKGVYDCMAVYYFSSNPSVDGFGRCVCVCCFFFSLGYWANIGDIRSILVFLIYIFHNILVFAYDLRTHSNGFSMQHIRWLEDSIARIQHKQKWSGESVPLTFTLYVHCVEEWESEWVVVFLHFYSDQLRLNDAKSVFFCMCLVKLFFSLPLIFSQPLTLSRISFSCIKSGWPFAIISGLHE